jgi:drug/metabolite transporter (DMT)-like permease
VQGFLTEGLRKTSAGLGSVIIDSQPLTVAVLAALLFGETLGPIAISGLGLGIVGLILLEVHVWQTFTSFSSSMTFFQVWI